MYCEIHQDRWSCQDKYHSLICRRNIFHATFCQFQVRMFEWELYEKKIIIIKNFLSFCLEFGYNNKNRFKLELGFAQNSSISLLSSAASAKNSPTQNKYLGILIKKLKKLKIMFIGKAKICKGLPTSNFPTLVWIDFTLAYSSPTRPSTSPHTKL